MSKEPIKIWRFEDAPEDLKMSCGGDEDWVALVSPIYRDEYLLPFECEAFGCNGISRFPIKEGKYKDYVIYVGMHA